MIEHTNKTDRMHPVSGIVPPSGADGWRSRQPGLLLAASLAVAWLLAPATGVAATTITPRITIGETYSDNIALAPDGQEDDEYVTEVVPGIDIETLGSRLEATLSYNMEAFYFADREDKRIFHQANGLGELKLIEDFLVLNGALRATQTLVDPTQRLPVGNISRSGNTTDVYSYSIGPAIHRELGSAAILDLSYMYRNVIYTEPGLSDSNSNRVELDLVNGSRFSNLNWRIRGSVDRQKFDSRSDREFRKVSAELGYPAERPLTFIATGGYEDNDFERAASRNKPSGSLWTAGLEWTPNSRLQLRAAGGRRFFGATYEAEIRYDGRKDQLQASYSEDPKTVSDTLTEALTPGTDSGVDIDTTAPAISSEVFIRKRLRLYHLHSFNRSDLWWSAVIEDREFEESANDERVQRYNLNWSWRLGRLTSLTTSGSWQDRDLHDVNSDYRLWYAHLGLSREFGRATVAELDYRYSERNGDNQSNDYTENRVSARLTFSF